MLYITDPDAYYDLVDNLLVFIDKLELLTINSNCDILVDNLKFIRQKQHEFMFQFEEFEDEIDDYQFLFCEGELFGGHVRNKTWEFCINTTGNTFQKYMKGDWIGVDPREIPFWFFLLFDQIKDPTAWPATLL